MYLSIFKDSGSKNTESFSLSCRAQDFQTNFYTICNLVLQFTTQAIFVKYRAEIMMQTVVLNTMLFHSLTLTISCETKILLR
jgi:hypothetical protein